MLAYVHCCVLQQRNNSQHEHAQSKHEAHDKARSTEPLTARDCREVGADIWLLVGALGSWKCRAKANVNVLKTQKWKGKGFKSCLVLTYIGSYLSILWYSW